MGSSIKSLSLMEEPSGVFVVALTGGPSGGKSTVQTMLSDVLENAGYKVYRVPETATILLGGGVTFADLDPDQQENFQENLLRVMMRLEQTFIDLAHLNYEKQGKKTVVLCDRGTMDPSAYIDRDGWLKILNKLDLQEVDIRDNRYDVVVHLVTAADGAEEFYTLENNATRSEGLELARHLDSLVKHAWIGHPHFVVVDNAATDFEKKCHRVVEAVLTRMGLPDKRWGKDIKKHKFLVRNFDPDAAFPVPFRDFNVEHRYLVNLHDDGVQVRMRKRFDESGTCNYTLTTRQAPLAGQRVEERRALIAREYEALKHQTDPSRHPIEKVRRCFLWDNHYYQLDMFLSPCPGLVLMEAYLAVPEREKGVDEVDGPVVMSVKDMLPPFMEIEREVTDEDEFSMFNLAKKVGS
ncbi:hypothetical protein AMAG_06188 [Allomyces macrogynus ATCC 38327]|uniref:NadR/Ttd14 AAA domain-containing protein n=1 Tax=Allomyces macrogynus (strain ATCC 38327) TaxID=578462 RepID=A0A0L0SFY7_ALLM3|nr:hypothetical protein AMAG_06188 [Allomyces macrogynus ATCC 38327]|eukprot:KNE61359.1 hypothetical protein AMAG_06188 [Allomyces macrogynus ATCC 38327]